MANGKESTCQAGDTRSIPALGRFPGERNGKLIQYPRLGNPMAGYSPWGLKVGHDLGTKPQIYITSTIKSWNYSSGRFTSYTYKTHHTMLDKIP